MPSTQEVLIKFFNLLCIGYWHVIIVYTYKVHNDVVINTHTHINNVELLNHAN
jgi:hypothetical protein